MHSHLHARTYPRALSLEDREHYQFCLDQFYNADNPLTRDIFEIEIRNMQRKFPTLGDNNA